jgi:mRNA-degrading endonuclease RelE of RelBE toxin-antitoxin system
MKYFVDWELDPLGALAAIWLQVKDRKVVTQAQARIDQALSVDPHGVGHSLTEGLYALEVHPLRVLYEIDDGTKVVTVVSVNHLP